jgi:hypothetical protein
MTSISRLDRIIVVGLVALLLALLAAAVADRSGAVRTTPPAATRAVGSRAGGPAATEPPSASSASSTTSPEPSSTTTVPSTAAPTTTAPTGAAIPAPVPGPVSAVGDSIMLDIQPYLQVDIPGARIDGMVSRQFETGIGVVQADRAAGTLGNVLIVELGTNGTVTPADFDAMMQAASGVERVVFVNVDVPRAWEAEDNAVLAAGVARYPGVAVLADWYTLSSGHPEWFTPDQVHLEPAGAQALAELVAQYA